MKILIAIVLICLVSGFYFGIYLQEVLPTMILPPFIAKCYFDFDCDWRIINCCPETAGAYWKCVNLKTFKEPDCSNIVICPQVVSRKPSLNCVCENGSCVAQ